MKDCSKIITVGDADELLHLFAQGFVFEGAKDVSIHLVLVAARGELRVETPDAHFSLPLYPRMHASRQWLHVLPDGDPSTRTVIVSPHVPDALAADLRRAGIAHADLNGRLFLQLPGLLIDRTPRVVRYQAPSFTADPFALKTARLVRALMASRECSWTQAALKERTGLSRGLVSRVLSGLIEEDFVIREGPSTRQGSAHYRVKSFDLLLDAWKGADSWQARSRIQQYSVLGDDPLELATQVRELLRDKEGKDTGVFTQWFAARLRHPYTDSPVVSVYVRDFPERALKHSRPVTSGGGLWLIKPKDEGVFLETQEVAGFPLVSDVQIYLDLLQVSQRGPEQAEALRAWEGFAR